ncbi:MAG: ATP-binding protein, partial [Pseudomonadota bacterium]
ALRAPRLLETIEEVILRREPMEVEIALRRAKTLHLCCHVVSLGAETRLPGGVERPAVLVAIEDRTQARHAEDLHRDFVANASHELKTPLAAVSGLIETLLGHAREDAAAQERFLPMMAAQTERMRHLVEDLLSLNRIELNERRHPSEPQPIRRIVGEVVEALRPLAESTGARILMPDALGLAANSGEIEVAGAREELAQVFVNLIENALKYGQDDGTVTLHWRMGEGEQAGMCGITVEDDGPGIAREHLPRLTERFYRVSVSRSRERGGTGLGLAIVKHILNRHRGRLEIDSAPGEGSRFTVWLPVLPENAADRTKPAQIQLTG